MAYSMKRSVNQIIAKKSNSMLKSVNNSVNNNSDSPKSVKTDISKDDYFIQISPRLETQTLTFTNKITKLKIIEHQEPQQEESVKSPSQPSKERIKSIVQKLKQEIPKSHFYNDMKVSRRLKTEQ